MKQGLTTEAVDDPRRLEIYGSNKPEEKKSDKEDTKQDQNPWVTNGNNEEKAKTSVEQSSWGVTSSNDNQQTYNWGGNGSSDNKDTGNWGTTTTNNNQKFQFYIF